MTTQAKIREFIIANFYLPDPSKISDETPLVTGGIVDSTGMLEVIAFLEEQFGIQIADTDTTPANLDTIGRMVAFVERKRAAAVAEQR